MPTARTASDKAPRALRADAQRNREALLLAAAAAFGENGVDTSLEDIAQRAHVGIGTLYRNFPTRETLIEAVYRNEVERLCDSIAELQAELPADQALAEWMQRFVAHVARKRGMAAALKQAAAANNKPAVDGKSELFVYAHERMRVAMSTLLDAGVAAGTVRADVDPMDLIRAMSGICLAIEPMLTLGRVEWFMWDDKWTVLTKDGSWAAQWEHTLVVTDDGAEILTLPSS